MREVNQQTAADPAAALAVSAQGEAVIPVGRNGEILANSPVSSDRRAISQTHELKNLIGAERLYEISGQPSDPIYSITKILWWKKNKPELFEKVWKFLCYGDFVTWKLGLEPVIDYSMASRMQAFDINELVWSPEILAKTGLCEEMFAKVQPGGTVIGFIPDQIAEELGFNKGVRVVSGGHDQPCGALGAGVLQSGEAMYAMGTTECIAAVLPHPMPELQKSNLSCYPHVIPGLFIVISGNQTGGRLLRWYRDELGSEEVRLAAQTGRDVYEIITSQIRDTPSSLFVLPHFAGSGTVYNDPFSKGAVLGLTFDTKRADIVKAVLEGITFEQAVTVKRLREAGVQIDKLRAIGGGSKSAVWLQLKANIMDTSVVSMNVSEAGCLGAAVLAGCACGIYASVSDAANLLAREKFCFEPQKADVEYYQERLTVYEKIYPILRDLNQKI